MGRGIVRLHQKPGSGQLDREWTFYYGGEGPLDKCTNVISVEALGVPLAKSQVKVVQRTSGCLNGLRPWELLPFRRLAASYLQIDR